MISQEQRNLAAHLSADIVCAYVAGETPPIDEVIALAAGLLQRFTTALADPNSQAVSQLADPNPRPIEPGDDRVPSGPTPAVPVRESVTPEYIICLEDGKRLKMLKRYLACRYGLTPQQYCEKWGLPRDYPMVARNYQQLRSRLALKHGLGRSADTPAAA